MDRDGVKVYKLAKEQGHYPAILTEQASSIKDLLQGFWGSFFLRDKAAIPELARWLHFALLGSQSERTIRLILPTLGATMGDKSVETLCHFRVLKANFFSNLYNTTPSPLLNIEFPVSRICLFLVQH